MNLYKYYETNTTYILHILYYSFYLENLLLHHQNRVTDRYFINQCTLNIPKPTPVVSSFRSQTSLNINSDDKQIKKIFNYDGSLKTSVEKEGKMKTK